MIYKAVTLYQPWAQAIFTMRDDGSGYIKAIETRSWRNDYAGEMAIHAGKEFGGNKAEKLLALDLARTWGFDPATMERSAVLGIVRIEKCWKFKAPPEEMAPERYRGIATGNYEPGRFGWKLRVIEKFVTPIPARGNRWLWNWNRP
jgi:hypothetical protein